jgi:hypothetical protein
MNEGKEGNSAAKKLADYYCHTFLLTIHNRKG